MKFSICSLIQAILSNSATAPTQPATPAKSESAAPTFLLPETAEEYRRRCETETAASLDKEAVAREKAEAMFAKANAVVVAAAGNEAEAELAKRGAAKICREAENFRQLADNERFVREHNNGPQAERELRQAEREKIMAEGKILSSAVPPPSEEQTKVGRGRPRVWDKTERRLVAYRGRFFVGSFCAEAETTSSNRRAVGGSHEGICYVETYRPTGQYGATVVEWVTESVAQMTDNELRLVGEHQAV